MQAQSPSPNPLLHPIQYVKGIGPRKAELLKEQGVRTVHDLLLYVPRRYLDRSAVVTIDELRRTTARTALSSTGEAGSDEIRQDYTVVGEVKSFRVVGFGKKARLVLVLADRTGSMQCVWFGGVQYWKNRFHVGEILAVSGQPSYYGSVLQFIHPDLDRIAASEAEEGTEADSGGTDWTARLNTGGLVPLYPSNKELERVGLDSGGFRRILGNAVARYAGSITDPLPESLMKSHKLLGLAAAISQVHFPDGREELENARRRLKYEELFQFQLRLALRRQQVKEDVEGIAFKVESQLARRLVDSLPFKLTSAQVRVIKEIAADMESPRPLNRLLQGDVGSGKTIVALVAMLMAVDNGYQAVFMAPTEILAEQHFKTLKALLGEIPVNCRLLVGGQRTRLRRDVLDDVQRGSAQIVVGTHALFEKGVEFAKLGFVVIDEQHRFGVMQRASLRRKGVNPDVLVMTATPIPRTLSLTLYGDLDVSVIDEMPRGRRPIKTVVRHDEEKEGVFQFIREEVRAGRQAYFVYPLIEESEKLDLKAATVHFQHLQSEVFPDLRLGLIHGRLSSEEKEAAMERFKRREIDILVATTVIEVGIDVPNASTMVIENAERFGLSQLHQLRGRVGRGNEQSYCILLARKWIARGAARLADRGTSLLDAREQERLAEKRLATMAATTDGFKIAEVDLQLRGPGDFFGVRQSGVPEFRVADLLADREILDAARADAFAIIEKDSRLQLPEHRKLSEHLRTFFSDSLSLSQVG